MTRSAQTAGAAFVVAAAWLVLAPRADGQARTPPTSQQGARSAPAPQTRPHSVRLAVDPSLLSVDDGDTVVVKWRKDEVETVRILGIDCPETRHPEHDLPFGQPFGEEARAFAQGAFRAATKVELLRAATLDPYGRTLGYVFVNGENYSVLVLRARLAEESISRYGDNGFPGEAEQVAKAAKAAGPLPFESPGTFRGRMRDVAKWMKAQGIYPAR
jgi:endonuclease YncB( thermonuclease family)